MMSAFRLVGVRRLSISLALFLLVCKVLPCVAQRGFGGYSRGAYGGFPGLGGLYDSGFDSLRPSRNAHSAHLWPYEGPRAYHASGDNYFDYRCPEYQPTTYSRWRETHDGRLATTISLPGVHHDNQRVWLGDDGSSLHVKAARSPSTQGGRHCLPRSAKVSTDGRAEILELEIPLPREVFDAQRAVLRNVEGGVEVLVPLVSKPVQPSTLDWGSRAQQAMPTRTALQKDANSATKQHRFKATRMPPVIQPKPKWTLPPSDGVEVVDDDWPVEEKMPDAASGWWDNRGEFQLY